MICILGFVIGEMRPDLIFGHGVDVGGDNGGHVAAPYFLLHYLLPAGRLTGWDPWWFDGFPLYVFYFPLPAVLVAALTVVMPYTIAFKVVTALGTITLPPAAYLFGRLAGYRRPVPVLLAGATLPFLFNTTYTIDGGNIASTMAGEFSFSLALSTGLLFLGVTAYTLRTGRLRWLAALLFAITCLCHVIPALAFGVSAVVLAAVSRPRAMTLAFRIVAPVGIVGALLAAWWLVPFASDLQYSSSMNYVPVGGPWPHWLTTNFLPISYLFVLIPAAIGALLSVLRRNRVSLALTISALAPVLAFHFLPSGLVYNARWLPFWYLYTALLAAYGIGELFRLLARAIAPSFMISVATVLGTAGAIVGAVFVGGLEGSGFLGYTAPAGHIQVSGWAVWNYSGVQARPGFSVWKDMVHLLDKAGRRYGCGRLQYEYLSETTDPFGSTEAMMSLPMWTRGCMQTTDGIYFESSTTTPYHFLDVSEVSQSGEAPDPVSGLNYPGFNLRDGVRHLQLMGVRYFLAMSPPVEAVAAELPGLERIGAAPSFPGPYNHQPVHHPHMVLYLVRNSPLVVPLTHLPVVESADKGQWLRTTLKWYEGERYWPTFLARSGPRSWPKASVGTLVRPSKSVRVGPTRVSGVHTGNSGVSFHVSRTGVPVLVKIPYFPNWEASGAAGPYEVSPNLMAVVPTSHDVRLNYGTTTSDWVGRVASGFGVIGLGALYAAKTPAPAMPGGEPFPGTASLAGTHAFRRSDEEADSESAVEQSVVLPAHNEQALIEKTLNALREELAPSGVTHEIIVVENGSTDRTAELVAAISERDETVRLVRLGDADYGEALRAGFLAARGSIVVNFDVDYYDTGFLRRAESLVKSGAADVVIASKRAPGSSDRRPAHRRLLTSVFASLMRLLVGLPVSDAHGMKVASRSALLPVIRQTQMGGSVFDVEVLLAAHRRGLKLVELPAQVREVRPPRTGVSRRAFESFTGLVKLRFIAGPPDEV